MTVYSARSQTVLPIPTDNTVGTGMGQHRVKMFGKFVVMKRESRCIICQSKDEDRTFVEERLFEGYQPAAIIRALPSTSSIVLMSDGRPAKTNTILKRFESHGDGHSNIEVEAGRKIQEHYVQQAGLDMAGVAVVTAMGFAQEGLFETYKAMKRGDISLTMQDGRDFMKFISHHEEKAGNTNAIVFQDAIAAIFDELQRHLDPTTVGWLIQSMEARPEIKAAVKALADADETDEQRALAS